MDQVAVIVNAIVEWLKIPFTIYGFTFSLWAVLCWTLLAGFVLWTVCRIFDFGD